MNLKLQRVQDVLRRAGLLDAVDRLRYGVARARNAGANRRFRRDNPDFPVPPGHIAFDAYGKVDWEVYRRSGRNVAEKLAACVRPHIKDGSLDILEWGCGGGRLIRHMGDVLDTRTISATDYNPESIAWCRENLPGINFQVNQLAPPLPFEDDSFDFVYSISVLTHLSEEMQYAWIEELRRVTRPDGVVLVSVKGEAFRPMILPEELERWDAGELVVRGGVMEGKKMYGAFHPERFMREKLLADVEVVEHIPEGTLPPQSQEFWLFHP